MKFGFGQHLMLDCYDCPKEKLSDIEYITNVLDTFPDKIGMHKILPPHVFKYQGKVPEDWGVSGVVLIAESHISIHTFPDKNHAFIDIFSSKAFEIDNARDELLRLFGARNHEQVLLNRGAEFPKSIQEAAKIIDQERKDLVGTPGSLN